MGYFLVHKTRFTAARITDHDDSNHVHEHIAYGIKSLLEDLDSLGLSISDCIIMEECEMMNLADSVNGPWRKDVHAT